MKYKKKFDLTNKDDIYLLRLALKDVNTNYPVVMDYLEEVCGFLSPTLSSDAGDHLYAGGKRDIILTTKTIMRDDIDPAHIAEQYKRTL